MLKQTLLATAGFTAVVLLGPLAQADPPAKDKGKDGLPPGLQKKDKLPPGWQKKVGNPGSTAPAAPATSPATTTPAPGKAPEPAAPASAPSAPKPAEPAKVPEAKPPVAASTPAQTPTTGKALTKEQQERQARLERHLSDFEAVASQPAGTERILGRLSRITNTPEAKLREQWKAQPGVTVSQFYVASVIARRSNSKTEQVLAEHKAGRAWGEVAVAHKVPIADLNEAMQEATAAARDAERKAQRAAN